MGSEYFKNKEILLISPENWGHLFVSKHHYAIGLAKNNRVYFLNPPSAKFALVRTKYKNLSYIDYTPFPKGLRFLPSLLQRYFMKRKYNQIQKIAHSKFDCIWSFDNSVFFDFTFVNKNVLTISHIVDYSQNFQLPKAAATAKICFGVSENIVELLRPHNKRTFLIPHGVSLEWDLQDNIFLPGSNSVKALYSGNLNSRYIDQSLLFSLVERNKDVDFIFLGHGGLNWERKNNVFFLGEIEYRSLGNYLRKADILLLVYNNEKFPKQLTNAHKILDYLASGKVIVSTFISDYGSKSELLEMARDKNDYLAIFGKVKSKLAWYNNDENTSVRKQYAFSNSYTKRLEEIEQLLGQIQDR